MTIKKINVSELATGSGRAFDYGDVTLDQYGEGAWLLTIHNGSIDTAPTPIIGAGTLFGPDSFVGAKIAPSLQDWYDNKLIQVRAGEDNSHIHIDSADNSTYDLILGDDSRYVSVDHNGYIKICDGNRIWYFRNGKMINPMNNAPETSVGVEGDMAGMVAYDENYIYVCTQDYVPLNNWVSIPVSNMQDFNDGTYSFQCDVSDPQLLVGNSLRVTHMAVYPNWTEYQLVSDYTQVSGSTYRFTFPAGVTGSSQDSELQYSISVLPDIWKRVALPNTPW